MLINIHLYNLIKTYSLLNQHTCTCNLHIACESLAKQLLVDTFRCRNVSIEIYTHMSGRLYRLCEAALRGGDVTRSGGLPDTAITGVVSLKGGLSYH